MSNRTSWFAEGEQIICRYRGDPRRETIAVRSDEKLTRSAVAQLLNAAYERGRGDKLGEIQHALGSV